MVAVKVWYIGETSSPRSVKADNNLHTAVEINNPSRMATFRCLYKQTFRLLFLVYISFKVDVIYTVYSEYHN